MIYLGLPWGLALLWRHRSLFGLGDTNTLPTSDGRTTVSDEAASSVEAPATSGNSARSSLIADMATLALGSLGPLALCLLVYEPSTFVDQVLGTYLGTRASYPVSLSDNLEVLRTWLFSDNAGLLALALAGALAILRRPSAGGLLATSWALLAVLTAMQHAPLWLKDHLEPLMFALAALAGAGVGWLVEVGAKRQGTGQQPSSVDASKRPALRVGKSRWLASSLIPWLAALAYLVSLPNVLRVDGSLLRARSYHNDGEVLVAGSEEAEKQDRREDEIHAAAGLIRRYVMPYERVVTDHQLVALHAGRRVAAASAAFSSRAVGVGAYSDEILIEAVAQNDVPLVLMWDEDIAGFAGFRNWLEDEGFGPPFALGKDRWAFVRADRRAELLEAQGGESRARFADVAVLLGHGVAQGEGDLTVSLYWETLGQSAVPLSIFVQLAGPDGVSLGQHDGPPDEGRMSTTDWAVPSVVVDRHRMELDGSIPEGSTLAIGYYDPASGERVRLEVAGEAVAGDGLILNLP
jgi:hypothetical protein